MFDTWLENAKLQGTNREETQSLRNVVYKAAAEGVETWHSARKGPMPPEDADN